LLIEDNAAFRKNAAALLEYAGYHVIEAENGQIGIQYAQEHQPDVILCDMSMPGMTGDEVHRALQASEQTMHLPFVFLTGLSDTQVPTGVRRLPKPLKLDALLAAINELV
jgi:CheY-like chemotaxis protein